VLGQTHTEQRTKKCRLNGRKLTVTVPPRSVQLFQLCFDEMAIKERWGGGILFR
jgi:hypothetical protein